MQIDLKKFLLLKKSKILFHGHFLSVIFTLKKFLEGCMKKNCKKANQTEFRIEKATN